MASARQSRDAIERHRDALGGSGEAVPLRAPGIPNVQGNLRREYKIAFCNL